MAYQEEKIAALEKEVATLKDTVSKITVELDLRYKLKLPNHLPSITPAPPR